MRDFIRLVENAVAVPAEIQQTIDGLTPESVGREIFDGWVLRYEGFSDLCIADAEARVELPPDDPRHLPSFDAVHDEVQRDWDAEERSQPVLTGMSGDPSNPIQWALYRTYYSTY